MDFFDVRQRWEEDTETGLVLVNSQDIPTDFLDECRSDRLASAHVRAGELHRVASVPAHLADLWLAQGFSVYEATPREIVRRLRRDGLDAFIRTNKEV